MHQPVAGQAHGENGDDTKHNAPEYRDRLRTWLIKMIDSGSIPGLQWENEEKTIFRMPWKHAGRQDYSLEDDSRIFMAWAIHSGRYREGIDKPEPIIWKTRLRCALNKMPDIREIPERSRLDISEPYRVYHLLPPVHKDTQIRRRLQRRNSAASNPDMRIPPPIGSPTFSRKDSCQNAGPSIKFTDSILPPRSLDLPLGVNHRDVGQRSPLDLGMLGRAGHWMNGPPLFGADNRLLQGLNFNGLSSPTNFQNFMNSANLFSPGILPRDFPRRPELDFPSVPYPASLVDQHGFNPFLHLPGAAAFGPFARFPSKSRDSNRNGPGSDMKPEVVFPLDKWGSKARKEEPDKTKYKIELLELEITRWKDAYEKERLCRQETETKYEYLQKALENVGGDILAMLRHGSRTTDDQPKNGDGLSKTQAKDPSVDDATEKSKLSRRQHHSEDSVTSNDRGMSKREDATLTKRPHERIGVLDLSGPSAAKKPRKSSSTNKVAYSPRESTVDKDSEADSNHFFLPENNATGNAFRFSDGVPSRISSDCDDTDVSIATNQIKPIKSPSVSSSYSSAEDSYTGSSLSPTIPRTSPVMPIFRSGESAKYLNYPQRADGAIHVT